MLIKRLILENFRQYIGRQEIEFSTDPEQNVTVLIGVNTSGKTTFVRAFEWILYNKNEFDNKSLLNQNVADGMNVGDTQDVVGIIVLEHGGVEYEITRRQKYTCVSGGQVRSNPPTVRMMYLQPDGQTKTEISSDFDSNIERILPRALSSYFFFGGERVGAISSRDDIQSSVKGLMGLDVLDNAMTHLRLVINKLKKSIDYSGDQKAADLQTKIDGAQAKLRTLEGEQENLEKQVEYYRTEKAKYAAQLTANEETAQQQRRREQLEAVISSTEKQIAQAKKELVSLFSRNGFTFFSIPLLKHAIELLDSASETTESVPEMTATSIDYILHRGVCICGTHVSPGSAAEANLLAEKKKQPPESIGSLVRRYREQGMEYLSSSDQYDEDIKSKFMDIRAKQRELGFHKDEMEALSKKLSGSKDVSTLENEYQKAERKTRDLERLLNDTIQKIGACKKDIQNFESALATYANSNKKNARIALNLAYAQAVFDWIATAYKEKEAVVRGKLEEKVNANFASMYHGSRTVAIDERYHVQYIDVTTEESDGLKAVKSFAFVSGLVDLAKEALTSESYQEADIGPQFYPLVMDAPFSNVDETHIKNISQILPKSAEQVIIAVMQKDWEPASPIMASFVGKSYHIVKDTDTNGKPIDTMTHIKEGA